MPRFRSGGKFVTAGASALDVVKDVVKDVEKDVEKDWAEIKYEVDEAAPVAEKAVGVGVHLLGVAIIVALVVIFLVIPECSHRPTRRMRPEDMPKDQWIVVPNSIVRIGTKVRQTNRITGDRTTRLSQDVSQDEAVLAPRSVVEQEFTAMAQGDMIPIAIELLDVVPWMTAATAHKRCEDLGFLVAVPN